jgi:hypothetical protein
LLSQSSGSPFNYTLRFGDVVARWDFGLSTLPNSSDGNSGHRRIRRKAANRQHNPNSLDFSTIAVNSAFAVWTWPVPSQHPLVEFWQPSLASRTKSSWLEDNAQHGDYDSNEESADNNAD